MSNDVVGQFAYLVFSKLVLQTRGGAGRRGEDGTMF